MCVDVGVFPFDKSKVVLDVLPAGGEIVDGDGKGFGESVCEAEAGVILAEGLCLCVCAYVCVCLKMSECERDSVCEISAEEEIWLRVSLCVCVCASPTQKHIPGSASRRPPNHPPGPSESSSVYHSTSPLHTPAGKQQNL